LADRLQDAGLDLALLDLNFGLNTAHLTCQKLRADVRDYPTISKLVRKRDALVHLAAMSRVEWGQMDPVGCLQVNTEGTLNLIEAVRKRNPDVPVIYASSREVYGEPSRFPVREADSKYPISVYGSSKLAAENLVRSYGRTYGLKYVILRFSNVYGSARDLPERVIPKFMNRALRNKPLEVYGGNQVLDFTFIDDVAEGIVSVLCKALAGEVLNDDFNFTSNRGTSVFRLASLIRNVCASESKVVRKSGRGFDVSKFVGDFTKAKSRTGYRPSHNLEHGLKIYRNRLTGAADEPSNSVIRRAL
jgi:nucleoside-diphosphate-sugar epimerase